MTSKVAEATPSAAPAVSRPSTVRKIVAALLVVLAPFALCLVSAQQLLVARNMPFGVVGAPSPLTAAVASRLGLDLTAYPPSPRR